MSRRFSRVPCHAARASVINGAGRVLIFLGAFANNHGDKVWPGFDLISEGTGIARKNLPRLLADLEAGNLISRERQTDKHGRPGRTVYRLNFDAVGASIRVLKSEPKSERPEASDLSRRVLKSEPLESSNRPRATLEQPIEQPIGTAHTQTEEEVRVCAPEEQWAAEEADRRATHPTQAASAASHRPHQGSTAGAAAAPKPPQPPRTPTPRAYTRARNGGEPAGFDRLWAVYPHRDINDPQSTAADRYTAAIERGADPADIFAGAERCAHLVEMDPDQRRYTKHLHRWLDGDCWKGQAPADDDDDVEPDDEPVYAEPQRYYEEDGRPEIPF
jgi:hypothetical protein